jgi:hypothetical protein
MTPDGTHDLEFLAPFRVPADAPSRGESKDWVARAIGQIEERVAADPSNSNEYFFWSDADDPAAYLARKARRPLAPNATAPGGGEAA